MSKKYFFLLLLLPAITLKSQVGINTQTPQAVLDVSSDKHGILIPRVSLTNTQILAPISNPQGGVVVNGTLVYNTATAGTPPNNVTPGFYYWMDEVWIALKGSAGSTLDAAYNSSGAGSGRIITANSGAVEINGTDGLRVSGTYNQGSLLPDLTAGSHMFFHPQKAAFRAGLITTDRWNSNNLGSYSFASGFNTLASGAWSTAMGGATLASGNYSTTMGQGTMAPSINETVIGKYNSTYTPAGSADSWNAADRLFTIGNGTSLNNRSDAFIVYKNGNTNINGNTVINGDVTTNGILKSSGTINQGNFLQDLQGGSHMLFYPRKGAFRVGYINDIQWNDFNIGLYSFASGNNTRASGSNSTAMGVSTNASGFNSTALGLGSIASGNISTAMGAYTNASGLYSTALGFSSIASGDYSITLGDQSSALGRNSIAMGYYTFASGRYSLATGGGSRASGDFSTAMGNNTTASGPYSTALGVENSAIGNNSTAMGYHTIAASAYETTMGRFSTIYTPQGGSEGWNENDALLVIGNGSGQNARSNALILQKNGNLTISGLAYKPGGGGWTSSSDARLKQSIKPYTDGLDKILSINPVYYHYNELSGNDTSKEHIGVIAQELEKTAPYMVGTFKQNDTEYLNVDNSAMTYMLINAIKEQQVIIEVQKKDLNTQKQQIHDQNIRIEKLEQQILSSIKK